MILLDTDTLTLLVQARMHSAEPDVATTIITWIEVMQGRFYAILKAADAPQLEHAHRRLQDALDLEQVESGASMTPRGK